MCSYQFFSSVNNKNTQKKLLINAGSQISHVKVPFYVPADCAALLKTPSFIEHLQVKASHGQKTSTAGVYK